MASYPKMWKGYEAQLSQLTDRGMVVTDKACAIEYLERIGYYRLSGYWYAMRQRTGELVLLTEQFQKPKRVKVESLVLDNFRQGTTFQHAVGLYVFDKQLRMLVLDGLERIEIALRVDVSHRLGKLDIFAYLKSDLLHDEFSQKLDKDTGLTRHHQWLAKHAGLIGRSKEEFVKHNKEKYGLPLPIWVACEVWDFGTLSTLFSGMKEQEQDAIAKEYGMSNGRTFSTWLRSLNYLRNVCAHHSRLWNRNIVEQPKLPPSKELSWVVDFENNDHARARCFLLLKLMQHLLSVINPNSSWSARMKAHLQDFPNLTVLGLNLQGMGAPIDWEEKW